MNGQDELSKQSNPSHLHRVCPCGWSLVKTSRCCVSEGSQAWGWITSSSPPLASVPLYPELTLHSLLESHSGNIRKPY